MKNGIRVEPWSLPLHPKLIGVERFLLFKEGKGQLKSESFRRDPLSDTTCGCASSPKGRAKNRRSDIHLPLPLGEVDFCEAKRRRGLQFGAKRPIILHFAFQTPKAFLATDYSSLGPRPFFRFPLDKPPSR